MDSQTIKKKHDELLFSVINYYAEPIAFARGTGTLGRPREHSINCLCAAADYSTTYPLSKPALNINTIY